MNKKVKMKQIVKEISRIFVLFCKNVYIVLIVLIAIMVTGCQKEQPRQDDIQPEVEKIIVYRYSIMTIDSCEYIGYGVHGFSHKGNCKYCVERRKQENKGVD